MTDENLKQLTELLLLQVDGPLDDVSKQRLHELLRNDREALQVYVEHCQIHTMLAWEYGALPAVRFEEQANANSPAIKVRNWSTANQWKLFALAASIFLAVGATWTFWTYTSRQEPIVDRFPHDLDSREVIAKFVSSRGAHLLTADRKQESNVGDSIRTGEYSVVDGYVQLEFTNGVEVIIESPASFDIKNSMRMLLAYGQLSARVSEAGKGFTVETSSSDVVDHGTEFAVEVSADQSSEVHVFEGEVEVRPKSSRTTRPIARDQNNSVRLVSNQATRFNSSTSVPQGIDIDMERFVRDLTEPAPPPRLFVRGLKPVTYLRMVASVDGYSLEDRGSKKSGGTIYRNKMLRPPFGPGYLGSALRLDGPGSEAYAVLPHYPLATKNNLTVSVWVRAESRPSWASIATNWGRESSGQFQFGLFHEDGDLEVIVHDADGNEVQVREHIPLPLTQWHHVAFVVDGDSLTLYRNAVPVASAVCQGLSPAAPNVLGIGVKLNDEGTAPASSGPGFWHGRIDELAIFHSSLSPDQIRDLYNVIRTSAPDKSK